MLSLVLKAGLQVRPSDPVYLFLAECSPIGYD
jgi:hypothetical protein